MVVSDIHMAIVSIFSFGSRIYQSSASLFNKYSVDDLADWTPRQLEYAGRISQPLFCAEGDSHYQEISWEEAYDLLEARMGKIRDEHGAESMIFVQGTGRSREEKCTPDPSAWYS